MKTNNLIDQLVMHSHTIAQLPDSKLAKAMRGVTCEELSDTLYIVNGSLILEYGIKDDRVAKRLAHISADRTLDNKESILLNEAMCRISTKDLD